MTRFDELFPRKFGADDRARLSALFEAAAAPAEDVPQPGEAAALAAFRELVAAPAGIVSLGSHRMRRRAGVAAGALTLALLGGGVAAAATGSLPGVAQQVASNVLGTVGVTVPGDKPQHPAHPSTPSAATAPSLQATSGDEPAPPAHPSHPAFPTTPPTPGNSGAAREHGVPAPGTHPSPGHGQPSTKPSPQAEAHPATPRPTATAQYHRRSPLPQVAVTRHASPSMHR